MFFDFHKNCRVEKGVLNEMIRTLRQEIDDLQETNTILKTECEELRSRKKKMREAMAHARRCRAENSFRQVSAQVVPAGDMGCDREQKVS